MDLKTYEKTRYQNIYRHKKNKNYIIQISKPVKTAITVIDGKRILRLEDAIKIRDNPKIRATKEKEVMLKEDFDTMWNKYIDYCTYESKLAYNTINQKKKMYNKYLKNKIRKKVTKITKQELAYFVDKQKCTDKQKNHLLKDIKAFFSWLVKEEYIVYSPAEKIKLYKIPKAKMLFWIPEEIKAFFNTVEEDIQSDNLTTKKRAYLIKTLVLIGFTLGDRIGETRALTYDCIDDTTNIVHIKHSINYNTQEENIFSSTKTYGSQRDINVTKKFIDAIKEYRYFLELECGYDIKDNDVILMNQITKRPYSDSSLRKHFKEYCIKANVKQIRIYDLRHTYVATMMAEGKELYLISERLGHSSYSTTVNKYGHLSNQIRKEIAEVTDKYI